MPRSARFISLLCQRSPLAMALRPYSVSSTPEPSISSATWRLASLPYVSWTAPLRASSIGHVQTPPTSSARPRFHGRSAQESRSRLELGELPYKLASPCSSPLQPDRAQGSDQAVRPHPTLVLVGLAVVVMATSPIVSLRRSPPVLKPCHWNPSRGAVRHRARQALATRSSLPIASGALPSSSSQARACLRRQKLFRVEL